MHLYLLVRRFIAEIFTMLATVCNGCIVVLQEKRVKPRFIVLALSLTFSLCIVIIIAIVQFENKYSYMPNVVGLTFNEAVSALQEVGIQPRFVFIETNNPTSPTCRVSWQSIPAESIVNRDDICNLLLDDCYFVFDSYTIDNDIYAYSCYMYIGFLSNTESAVLNALLNRTYPTIQILATHHSHIVRNVFNADTQIQFLGYSSGADSFARFLTKIATIYISQINDSYFTYMYADYASTNFGKLLPQEGDAVVCNLYSISENESEWIISCPSKITTGNYKYVCTIIREDGASFEFTIPIVVEL